MLEHGSFCFKLPHAVWCDMRNIAQDMETTDGFKHFMRFTDDTDCLISGNVRAWRDFVKKFYEAFDFLPCFMKHFIRENAVLFPEYQDDIKFSKYGYVNMSPVYLDDLKTENEFLTHCDITVRFVVDRGVSHEIVRHRPASFAQESTRYCNYGKDKFGGQLTFIIPEFFDYKSTQWNLWKNVMECIEKNYLEMLEHGVTPEQSRTILPNSLKTELIMTANCAEWVHFFELRACNKTGKAHPQMLEVTVPLLDDFKNMIYGVFDNLKEGV
jgi:thymidylate synthase (FAD)